MTDKAIRYTFELENRVMTSEYKVFRQANDESKLEEEVNRLSQEGWELVNVSVAMAMGAVVFVAAMKRPLKS